MGHWGPPEGGCLGGSVGEPSISVVCTFVCVFVRILISCGYLLMCYFCAWESVQGRMASFLSEAQVPHPN